MNEGDQSVHALEVETPMTEADTIEATGAIPRALYQGVLRFGEIEVTCYVLADGTALLTTRGILAIFAGHERGNFQQYFGRIPEKFRGFSLDTERRFRLPGNNAVARGYTAETLTKICSAYTAAFWAGALHPSQRHLAAKADVILRAVANVGITALAWEATGYDKVKAAGALQDKLALVLREEAGAWEQLFTMEFFAELARLHRLELRTDGKRPMVFAAFLAEFFYEWFDAEVYDAVKRRNPRRPELDGERRHCHHQFLTPAARARFVQHRGEVLRLMRACPNLADFRMRFNAAYRGGGLQLAFGGV
jgi:hypothetical protein